MNEDWDDMTFAEPLAGEELERLLARYARVRLDPSHAQAKRARSAVMEQAWRRRIEASHVASSQPARHVPFSGWGVRRFGASLTAAMFAGLLIGTSVFASSRAGGPLYESRLALEELGYPSDPGTRTDAQLVSADERLSEAWVASARQDDGATAAALAAYDRTLADIETTATGPAADRAVTAIQKHHQILEDLARSAPEAAIVGLDRALRNSDRVVQLMIEAGTGVGTSGANGGGNANGQGSGPGNPGTGPGGAGSSTATPDGIETASPNPKPVEKPTDDPAATPRPTREPKPDPTPKPAETETPHRTPKPQPTPAGGPGGNPGGGGQDEDRTPRGGPTE